MDINQMTRRQFEALPHREWDKIIIFDSLIILPARVNHWSLVQYSIRKTLARFLKMKEPDVWEVGHLHDSGFRCMDFVAVLDDEPICLLSGCSDVIHIDGISGFGYQWLERYGTAPRAIPPSAWRIDCLAQSGLLRIWSTRGKMTCDLPLSSFEIYALGRNDIPVPISY